MRARVLVTRPEPGASATANRLSQAGFDPVLLPLTEIASLPIPPDAGSGAVDRIVATSANAFRHAPRELLARLIGKTCFTVGEETAKAAVEAGLSVASRPQAGGNADALARLLDARRGERIVYLAGKVRRPELEARLLQAGAHVEVIETYAAVPVVYSPAKLGQMLGNDPIDAVLLYSAKAAEGLAALDDAERRFAATSFFGLSDRIGMALPPSWRKRFRAAGTPDEAPLFWLLDEAFPPTP